MNILLSFQWTVSGPAGQCGVHAQPAVVPENRPPPDLLCSLVSMEEPHVKASTYAPRHALLLTVVSEARRDVMFSKLSIILIVTNIANCVAPQT